MNSMIRQEQQAGRGQGRNRRNLCLREDEQTFFGPGGGQQRARRFSLINTGRNAMNQLTRQEQQFFGGQRRNRQYRCLRENRQPFFRQGRCRQWARKFSSLIRPFCQRPGQKQRQQQLDSSTTNR